MRILYTVILLFGLGSLANAQKSPASIRNLKMEVRENRVYINYDLVPGKKPHEQEVFVKFYTDKNVLIDPISVSGDVGPSVPPGNNKTIIWDISQDLSSLNGKYYPKVILNYDQYINKHRGGPNNALLSLMVPGLGDYFVADPAEMKIPPYVRTIASWGLMATGIIAMNYRHPAPGEWKTTIQVVYERGRGATSKQVEYYDEGPMQYYLFRGDAELFLFAGACIWVYDILWVSSRGMANQKLIRNLENQELSLVPVRQGIGLSYRLTF